MAIYSYDGEEYDENDLYLAKTYHEGRVAWNSDGKMKVTTLATGSTKEYLNTDNERVAHFWLGRDLLIAEPLQ